MKQNTGWPLCLFQQEIKAVELMNAEREGPMSRKMHDKPCTRSAGVFAVLEPSMNIGHITVEYPALLFASKQCIWKKGRD